MTEWFGQSPMTQHWFGKSWGAPCCEPELFVATPVGEACLYCKEPILADDQGLTTWVAHALPSVGPDATAAVRVPVHLDCYLKKILPHGPECPRCRGLDRAEHLPHCNYRMAGQECNCEAGELAP